MTSHASRPWRRYYLALLVHLDAFRADPGGYLQGVVWRIRRLRVRSNHRFAALMGRSPNAYALWIARNESQIRAALLADAAEAPARIIPVIRARPGAPIDDTLHSISDHRLRVQAIVVGWAANGAPQAEGLERLGAIVQPGGTWLCIVDAGDRFAAGALETYAAAAAGNPGSWIIYADDDLIERGRRDDPHFKCAWNPELFEHHDFITGSAIVRVVPEMLDDAFPADWPRRLVDEALKRAPPVHLPAVLHHRRRRPEPKVPAKPGDLHRQPAPSVTIIIPTRNQVRLLRDCIEGVRRTRYPDIELVVVDNDSDDPDTLDYLDGLATAGTDVLKVSGAFNFSALNNAAAARARGALLCFLNNDVEILDEDWLRLLVRHAVRPDIGAVGGRLLYPDGSVQHAGVITGVGGGAAHAHRLTREGEPGYFQRDRLPQRISAVTAACMVVAKDKFLAVGGFNEKDFPVAFNDVDLCLKLNQRGWQAFYEPRAVLVHHESKSRGLDDSREKRARFAAELAALKRHWGTDRLRDPYHHPHLSPFCEQFRIAV